MKKLALLLLTLFCALVACAEPTAPPSGGNGNEDGDGVVVSLYEGDRLYAGLEILDIVTSDPASPYYEKYCSTGVQCLTLDAADMALVWELYLGGSLVS